MTSDCLHHQERLASNPTLDVLTRPNWRQSKNIHGEAAWPLVTSSALLIDDH